MTGRTRALAPALALALAGPVGAAACAGSATIDEATAELDAEDAGGREEAGGREDAGSREDAGGREEAGEPAPPVTIDSGGVIVVSGRPRQLIDSMGTAVGPTGAGGETTTQPTWSRSGSRVILTSGSASDGTPVSETVVLDGFTGEEIDRHPASRPHFFFSWSHEGDNVAALGPGRFGTTLDVLDADGAVRSAAVVEAGSLFLAWEPSGDRIVAHADDELLVLEPDGAGVWSTTSLGTVGTRFFAPKWIPGSSDIVLVRRIEGEDRLVRQSVLPTGDGADGAEDGADGGGADPLDLVDLGPVRGAAGISVHPDGATAVLTHIAPPADDGDDTVPARFVAPAPVARQPSQEPSRESGEVSAAVEIVDLATGARSPIVEKLGWWAEWSPDGERLLLATLEPGEPRGDWHVWDDGRLDQVASFVPTQAFFTRYMQFSDQYVEQPRLWSPDSDAFVITSRRVEGDRVLVAEAVAGGEIAEIGEGSVAFWSPVAPRP